MALALAARARPGLDIEPYAAHLDLLAEEAGVLAYEGARGGDPVAILNTALFQRGGYRGDDQTYDDLANADLIRVIDRRRGLPISLSILYLHAARAQGWPAEGINFPGHFLVRIGEGPPARFVDPFAGGVVRGAQELQDLLKRLAGPDIRLAPQHLAPASNRDVLLRLQNNIKSRCIKSGDTEAALAASESMNLVAPGRAGLWYDTAVLAAELGQLQRARTSLDAAARLDRENRLGDEIAALSRRLRTQLN
ncbi:MAG: transglutaminase family protein [Rhodospirillaceae bacterium]|nr:transglutaminase family protein [Rhodospirillaceae bacterium]